MALFFFALQIKIKFEATVSWAYPEVHKGVANETKPCAKPGCTPFPQCCTTDSFYTPNNQFGFV